jgi:hypothetical protein
MENRYAVGFDHPFDFFADAAWHPMLGALALLIVVACLVSAGVITVVVSMVRERPRTVASHAEGHIGVSGP